MELTIVEKMQLVMLCDLAKRPRQRVLDFDFIRRAVLNDDLWALNRKYLDWDLDAPMPPEVERVYNILEMWESIEMAYERLDEAEQERVRNESYMLDGPRFPGFFGAGRLAWTVPEYRRINEVRIARIFIEEIGQFERFKVDDRYISSDVRIGYDRMFAAWRPINEEMWKKVREKKALFGISADDIICIVRERIEPSKRRMEADGRWTPPELINDKTVHR